MSLKEKDKRMRLINEDQNHLTKKVLNISLVIMFLLQLFLPVGLLVNASSTGNDSIEEPATVEVQAHESDVSEDLEDSEATVESPILMNAQEEEEDKPEEEVADDSNQAEELDTEAKENAPPEQETEENTDEQPPAPEPKPESEKVEEEKEEPSETEKPEVVEDDVEEEDEYDPGAMLDGFPATPHPDNPGSIIRYAKGSLGSALALLSGARMMTRNTEGLAPGEVRTSKTATPVPGMVNTWDITVRVEGRDDEQVETTDIVLVIDRSGSMTDNNRMANAKAAAINFINTMIPADDNLRIAIVSYSSSYQGAELVTINRNFTRNINQLTSSVNSLVALGGTHTQAGILQGQELLAGSDADNKHMVLLSDGEPTYSYEPQSWTTGRPSWGTAGNVGNDNQRTGVYDGNFNTGTIVGTGSDVTQSYNYVTGSRPSQTTYRRHIHNGLAAIKAGQDARTSLGNSGELFTIAVEAGNQGTSILQDIASPGFAYSTQNPGELQEIYDMIATQISTQYALRAPSVVDEMGNGFTLIENTLGITEGTTSATPATDSNNQTINWDISPTVTNLVSGSQDVRYAEMTYRVEINDDILGLPGAKTDEHKLFKTNKFTELSYTDTNDKNQTKPIESPEVDPVLLKVKKILKDGFGNIINNDERRFNVQMSKASPNSFSHTESLVPGANYVWLTSLRHEGTYNVQETSITGPGETNLDQFNISYSVDGVNKTNFVVNHNQTGTPRGDVTIEITNQEIRNVDITATKIWVGGPEIKPDIQLQLLRNGSAFGSPVTLVNGVTSYTWSGLNEIDEQGNPYIYTVREVSAPAGYESEADGLTVKNTYIIPSAGVATATKVWEGGSTNDHVAVDLTLWRTIDGITFEEVNSTPTITPNSSNTEFSYVWDNLAETDVNGNEFTFYFTEDTVPDGFERIYSNALTKDDIEYGKTGSKVTNRQMIIDFSFKKVDEVGNDLLGAIFKLEKHVGNSKSSMKTMIKDISFD